MKSIQRITVLAIELSLHRKLETTMLRKKITEREEISLDPVKDVSFEEFLRRDVRIFQFAGFFSMDSVFSDKPPNPTIWETVVIVVVLIPCAFILSCEFFTVLRVWRHDPNYAIGCAAAMFSGLLCVLKGFRIWFCREEFREILRLLAVSWEDSKSRKRLSEKNFQIAAETYYVGKLYIIMAVMLAISYGFRPYILLLHYHLFEKTANTSYDYSETIFPTTYVGFSTETISKYIMCVSWEQIIVLYIILWWMASDVMFAQITTHMAIQFRVLCHDLEYVTDADDDYGANGEKIFINRLSVISKRHRDLYKYCEMLERIYNPIIFLTMLLTGVNMCMCVLRLQMEVSNKNWEEVFKSLFQVITLIIQAIMYCGYADKLTQQSSLMSSAAYLCQWIDRSKEFKVRLQIIMMRSQKIFELTAYGFFLVNLNQVTAIVNTAASYFALLKTMT